MKPIRFGRAAVLALIPAGVFYGWGGQALAVYASALAVVLVLNAVYEGRKQPNKTVFISHWPDGSIQWNAHMSQADVLAFLDKVRDFVLANPLAKSPAADAKEPGNE